MTVISVLVAIVVVSVLLFTSQTWAEVPVLLLTFCSAALITKGTNFMMGTISFVSNSVTIVLQLALSVDYAVIFCNRYKEEPTTKDKIKMENSKRKVLIKNDREKKAKNSTNSIFLGNT